MMNYLAAVGLGGTLALLFATGIISFFHFVTEERRQRIARAFKVRASRLFLRQSGLSRSPHKIRAKESRFTLKRPSQIETGSLLAIGCDGNVVSGCVVGGSSLSL